MAFDPYYQWLGIPPSQQPPDHYRLLSLTAFEPDTQRINAAADRLTAQIKEHATGAQLPASHKLIYEISNARVCLLNPDAKAKYDSKLRAIRTDMPVASPPPAGQKTSGQKPPVASKAALEASPSTSPSHGQTSEPLVPPEWPPPEDAGGAATGAPAVTPQTAANANAPTGTQPFAQQPGAVQPYPVQQPGAVQPYPAQQPGAAQFYPAQQPGVVQPYPAQQPGAAQPYPAQQPGAVQPYPAQPYPAQQPGAAQPYPAQPVAGQPFAAHPFPQQPGAVHPYPAQPVAGQPVPGQPVPMASYPPAQPVPGQPFSAEPVGGVPFAGQPVPTASLAPAQPVQTPPAEPKLVSPATPPMGKARVRVPDKESKKGGPSRGRRSKDKNKSLTIMGIVGVACVILVGILVIVLNQSNPKPITKKGNNKKDQKVIANNSVVWHDAAKAAADVGIVRISIMKNRVAIGPMPADDSAKLNGKDPGYLIGAKNKVDSRDYLLVQVRLTVVKEGKINFTSWSTSASLKDDEGNNYLPIDLARAPDTKSVQTLSRGDKIDRMLVFQQPVSTFKQLRLTLPGGALGAEKNAYFRIKSDFVVRATADNRHVKSPPTKKANESKEDDKPKKKTRRKQTRRKKTTDEPKAPKEPLDDPPLEGVL